MIHVALLRGINVGGKHKVAMPDLRRIVAECGGSEVVTYINSGGLRCLVSSWRKARQQSGDLILCGLSSRLHEIFAMVGFDKVFQITTTIEEAQVIFQKKT